MGVHRLGSTDRPIRTASLQPTSQSLKLMQFECFRARLHPHKCPILMNEVQYRV